MIRVANLEVTYGFVEGVSGMWLLFVVLWI